MLSTLILYIEVPEMTLLTRINNNAHADMHSTPYQRENIHIRGHLLQSCFGLAKFSGFQCTKTSVNKRLKLCHAMFRLGVGGQDNPARLSPAWSITAAKVQHKKEICKGEGDFFCRGGVSELNSNDLLRCTDAMDIEDADWQSGCCLCSFSVGSLIYRL